MPGSKSDYLERALLDGVLGGPQFTLPPIIYVAVATSLYSDSATGSSIPGEVSFAGTGYSRCAVANNSSAWNPSTTNATTGVTSKTNAGVFTFTTATANWGLLVAAYIVDAPTGGNVLYGGDLTTSRDINSGDTASFAALAITLTEA